MPRPCCLRHIGVRPCAVYYKPAGIPLSTLEEVVLTLDELESLRLADLEGLYQEEAAAEMGISRPTFSRVVSQARRKVAEALVHGRALRLAGGAVVMKGEETMPDRDGTGPRGTGSGRGQGPCGCGGRRGAAERGEAGMGERRRWRRGMCCADASVATPAEPTGTAAGGQAGEGGQEA
ncbi:MAG: DUF134 domain-containing protein [Candidatus Latescibacterota bacterium]